MLTILKKVLIFIKKIPPVFIFCNGISLLLLLLLLLYAQKFEPSVQGLFIPPATPPYPTGGLLTHTFEALCSISPVICGFSFLILIRIAPNNRNNWFILGSAILTSGFFVNEIYRIHIIVQYFDIPKLVMIKVYGIILILYLLLFWNHLKSTPYGIILTSILLIFLAVFIDTFSHKLPIQSLLVEGIPKLFGIINLSLYFYLVCYRELLKAFMAKE